MSSVNRVALDDRVAKQIQLLNDARDGRLDKLDCPVCHEAAVSVWFTNPADETYRTWFLCGACDFCTRAQELERPHFFSDDRRRLDLEERDSEILKNSMFKDRRNERNERLRSAG